MPLSNYSKLPETPILKTFKWGKKREREVFSRVKKWGPTLFLKPQIGGIILFFNRQIPKTRLGNLVNFRRSLIKNSLFRGFRRSTYM